ncbi:MULTISPECIES: ABC transporter permease [unclassified Pseudonocardia]|uniref:ABC transporter permease n=1 Tax=unclassified Pseudonocardia TaxID=2619320 RepID=UPI00094B4554|nr:MULTISPECIES: ABC transporter permease [unclassified Pseudonocardia]
MTALTSTTPSARVRPPRRLTALLRRPKFVVGASVLAVYVLIALVGPLLVGDPSATGTDLLAAPSAEHLLGTNNNGQDILAQTVVGFRSSLMVGVLAGVLTMVLATIFGVVAGYAGAWIDETLNLVSNIFLVVPSLPLIVVAASYLQGSGLVAIAVLIAITSWAAAARVLRAQTASLSHRDYVEAARASGERPWRIVLVEVLPNLYPILISQFVFAMIGAVLAEAGLSFLGLGDLDSVTWGTMLFFAQNGEALLRGAWWWFIPPGLCISVLGAGLTLLNMGLDELLNPRLRLPASRAGGEDIR